LSNERTSLCTAGLLLDTSWVRSLPPWPTAGRYSVDAPAASSQNATTSQRSRTTHQAYQRLTTFVDHRPRGAAVSVEARGSPPSREGSCPGPGSCACTRIAASSATFTYTAFG
jgi:hypothetical protein